MLPEGAQVAITGRDLNTLASAAESVGGGAVAIPGDITAAPDRERLFDTIKERFGALDVVFANAGMSGMTPLGSTVEKQFEDLVRINFTSVFFTVQGALPLLRDGAAIVLTGSITSVIGAPSNAAYAGSKAAVRAMARVFAAELSARKIRVNVVTPGFTRTPLWERRQALRSRSRPLPRDFRKSFRSAAGRKPMRSLAPSSSSRATTLPTVKARRNRNRRRPHRPPRRHPRLPPLRPSSVSRL